MELDGNEEFRVLRGPERSMGAKDKGYFLRALPPPPHWKILAQAPAHTLWFRRGPHPNAGVGDLHFRATPITCSLPTTGCPGWSFGAGHACPSHLSRPMALGPTSPTPVQPLRRGPSQETAGLTPRGGRSLRLGRLRLPFPKGGFGWKRLGGGKGSLWRRCKQSVLGVEQGEQGGLAGGRAVPISGASEKRGWAFSRWLGKEGEVSSAPAVGRPPPVEPGWGKRGGGRRQAGSWGRGGRVSGA